MRPLVLSNVDQGFITLDLEGRMSDEHSLTLTSGSIASDPSMPFWDYLARVDAAKPHGSDSAGIRCVRTCCRWLFPGPASPCRSQERSDLRARLSTHLEKEERLDKTIVVITDVTTRIERERASRPSEWMSTSSATFFPTV
jgi:hypothetical protein